MKAKRNDLCPCGSGKKFKKCCMQTEIGLSGQDLLSSLRQLRPAIEDFGRQQYGGQVVQAGWKDFSRWGRGAIAREEQAYQSAFAAWFLFAWLPDDSVLEGERFLNAPSDHAIAFDYLKANREHLSPIEQGVIEVSATSPYSFYTVVAVAAEDRLQCREIYTGQTLIVEGVASKAYAEGDVLFTAVLSVNGVSVLLGCMPKALGATAQSKIEAHREKWRAEEGKAIDRRLLYLHDTELRRFYFVLLSQVQRAKLH